jgi:hypothetical protein
MVTTHSTIIVINIVIALTRTRRHFSLRICFLSAVAFSSMASEPSLQVSLPGSTLTSGIPSTRQKAVESSA